MYCQVVESRKQVRGDNIVSNLGLEEVARMMGHRQRDDLDAPTEASP